MCPIHSGPSFQTVVEPALVGDLLPERANPVSRGILAVSLARAARTFVPDVVVIEALPPRRIRGFRPMAMEHDAARIRERRMDRGVELGVSAESPSG